MSLLNREKWLWIALLIAVILLLAQWLFGVRYVATDSGLPLLTVLLMNEFGFVLCCIGVGTGVKVVKNHGSRTPLVVGIILTAVFAVIFLWSLIRLYPTGGG